MFLRGRGSQVSALYGNVIHASGALGAIQGDAIRNITGAVSNTQVYSYQWATGAFGGLRNFGGVNQLFGGWGYADFDFDASRIVPVANENRPVNVAVRYLIRALN
jgi:hypothetical protein